MHLWEEDHPYYCNESNYFKSGWNFQIPSWAEFAKDMGQSDPELNLLFRWDWKRYEDEGGANHTLKLFFVLQRKGIFACWEVEVTEEDEPSVKEWLSGRLPHLLALWTPIFQPTA